jgi:hypothetical protein
MRKVLIRAARPVEVLLGIVFIAGAMLKALDINLFSVQIDAYGVITSKSLQPLMALATLCAETFLGGAMLLGMGPRKLVLAALEALLAVFTALILYGWVFHGLQDCGCFGALEVGPKTSLAKNLVFALLAAVAWSGFSMGERPPASLRRGLVKLAIISIFTAATVTYAWLDLRKQEITTPNDATGPYARFVFDVDQQHFDLGQGEYLVALLSMSCDHCMEQAPRLNDLVLMPDLPPIVALCLEESAGDMDEFRAVVQPVFPMYSIGAQVRLFFNLIGKEPPRLTFIRDGQPIHFWDGDFPPYEELVETIQGAAAPS